MKIQSIIAIFLLVTSLTLVSSLYDPNNSIKDSGMNQGDVSITSGNNNSNLSNNKEANTSNKGEDSEIRNVFRERIRQGNYTLENGKKLQIQTENNNRIMESKGISAKTKMNLSAEMGKNNEINIKAEMSNGKKANIMVMPDVASEIALNRLRLKVCSEENNCSLELKEVGEGNETKAVYEVKRQRNAKVLGLFKTKMDVGAEVDAETGGIRDVKKPWWAFLASEPSE